MPAAFLTGVVLAGVALGALLIGEGVFAVIAAAVVLLAQGEFFGVMAKHHRQPATAVGLLVGALMMAGAYFHGEAAVLAMFALGVMATFLWFMAGPAAHRKDTIVNIGPDPAGRRVDPAAGQLPAGHARSSSTAPSS